MKSGQLQIGQSPVPLQSGPGTSLDDPSAPAAIIGIPLARLPHGILHLQHMSGIHTCLYILGISFYFPPFKSAGRGHCPLGCSGG